MIPLAGGVVLHSIWADLPQHPAKRYRLRREDPQALFVHHSGADNGRNGVNAFVPMARWHINHHGWAGIGYHYGITQRPSFDHLNNLVVFGLQPPWLVSNHTGGVNRTSCGVVVQGNYNVDEPADHVEECLEALIPWWMEVHERNAAEDLGWHSIADDWGGRRKLACPGAALEDWLEDYVLAS